MQLNNYVLYSSGTQSCHAVAKRKRKFSVTGEGSKNQAEASITGMSLSELSPPHSLVEIHVCEVLCGSRTILLEVFSSLYALHIPTVKVNSTISGYLAPFFFLI